MPAPKFPPFNLSFEKHDWVLGRVLEYQAVHRAQRPFLQWTGEGSAYSFAETNRIVNRIAHGLRQLGLKKGDIVIVMMPNSLEFIFTWFAANKLGAVEAPINTAYKGSFLEHQVNTAKAKIMVVADEFLDRVYASEERMPSLETVVVWSRDGQTDADRMPFKRLRTVAFADVMSTDESNPNVDVDCRDLAAIVFTSGTTGPSKGVMMPHAQLYFFSEQNVQLVRLSEDDCYMTTFPLFHGNAQFLTVYPCLIVGARCVVYERFSASEWVDQLWSSGATVTNSLGVTQTFIHSQAPTERDKGHDLRCIFAVPTAWNILPAFKARFGVAEFAEVFGQTEISLPFMTPPGAERPAGSCGVLVDQWFDVRLVDPDTDEEVPVGDVGELLVRHKEPWTISIGYFGMPERTLDSTRNLWFHTGDGLRRDVDGWYYFVDRVNDALRRRGENISSFEVEAPIAEHPAVAECAVVAAPAEHEAGEDEVKACIVLNRGATLTPETLIAWCDERMPHFAVPRYVEFMDSLPKTPSEKIQKNMLRKDPLNERTWDRLRAGVKLRDEVARAQRRRD